MLGKGNALGIDIGASSIKLVELAGGGKALSVVRSQIIPINVPADAGPSARKARVAELLLGALDPKRLKGCKIAVSVPGQGAFTRYPKLPPVAGPKLDQMVVYEAQQQIPFPLTEVIWDYCRLRATDPTEVNVVIVAAKTAVVEESLEAISVLNRPASVVTSTALGAYNGVKYGEEPDPERVTLFLDMGASTTDLSIEREGRLVWTTTIGQGGADVTAAIARELGVGLSEAEALKIERGAAPPPEGEVSDSLGGAIAGVLDSLITELQRSIGYFRSQLRGRTIHRVVLSGGAAKLRGLPEYIAARLGTECVLAAPLASLMPQPDPQLATAAGLALQAAGESEVDINLLPPHLVARQRLEKKVPFVAAAFGVAVLGMVAMRLVAGRDLAALSARLDELSAQVQKYSENSGAYNEARRRLEEIEERLAGLENVARSREKWVSPLLELVGMLTEDVWLGSVQSSEFGTVALGLSYAPGPTSDYYDYGYGDYGVAGPTGPAGPTMMRPVGSRLGELSATGRGAGRASEEPEALGDTLTVVAFARSTEAMGRFIKALRTSPRFSAVTPDSSRFEPHYGYVDDAGKVHDVVRFVLTLTLETAG